MYSIEHLIQYIDEQTMSYSFHIGLRHIVKEDAPFWNGNAIEDVGLCIQSELNIIEFKARELFKPHEQTLTGTNDKVFSCILKAADMAGMESSSRVPEGLLELAPQILSEVGQAPNTCELPGPESDILVPNLPNGDSPSMDALVWHKALDCRNKEVFGREEIYLGSLNAKILTIEAALAENLIESDCIDLVQHMLARMKLAQRYDLFFTFCY